MERKRIKGSILLGAYFFFAKIWFIGSVVKVVVLAAVLVAKISAANMYYDDIEIKSSAGCAPTL